MTATVSAPPRDRVRFPLVEGSSLRTAAPADLDRQLEQHRSRADGVLLPDARRRRSRPRTRCRRRSFAPGAATSASRAARRCARGSTGSRRTSASTCSGGTRAARAADGPRPGARAGDREPERAARGDVDRADPRPAPTSPSTRETIRLAFVAALQHLPPRQRAALILCEVLRWQATEVAELLDTSVASVNSALQRARATLAATRRQRDRRATRSTRRTARCSRATSSAFERYDIDALTSLIHEDATQSMPPFDLWLTRPRRHLHLVVRPGDRLPGLARDPDRRPRTARRRSASTSRAPDGGYEPWALQVIEISGRPDRRVHVLPRHRDALPALRAARRGSTP